MILESKNFVLYKLDGTTIESSSNMGIVNAVLSNGMYKQQIVGTRKILETKIPGRATPYFYGVDKSPLKFKMGLATNGEKTLEELNAIVSNFLSNEYQTIKFAIIGDTTSVISYDFIVVGSPEIEYTGDEISKNAIISLEMRCNSFSGYVNRAIVATGDLENNYYESIYPNIELTAISAGDISIVSNQGSDTSTFEIKNCTSGEVVTLDMTTRLITSSTGRSLYNDWTNKEYLKLFSGSNTISVSNCTFEMNWKEPKLL